MGEAAKSARKAFY